MKKMYSKLFGGVINVKIVSFFNLPNQARYEYSDDLQGIDVYLYTDINQGTKMYFGVVW